MLLSCFCSIKGLCPIYGTASACAVLHMTVACWTSLTLSKVMAGRKHVLACLMVPVSCRASSVFAKSNLLCYIVLLFQASYQASLRFFLTAELLSVVQCFEFHPSCFLQALNAEVEPCSTGCVGGNFPCLFIGVLPDHWRHVLHLSILSCSDSKLLGSHNGACGLSIAFILVAYQREVWSSSFALDWKFQASKPSRNEVKHQDIMKAV